MRRETGARWLRATALVVLLLARTALAQDAAPAPPVPSALELGIVEELNAARSDPAGYAAHLEAMLPLFQGTVRRSAAGLIQTREGVAAVREAIAALRGTAPMGPLRLSAGLSAAARDHARDQASTGAQGHDGSDGSDPSVRAGRHGRWGGGISENISYGPAEATGAREVVVRLLVDDGVPGRGHRTNILDSTMRRVGVACGQHPRFAMVCVMVHAREYQER